ncbi:hypothetical protein ATN84_24740 [Paramesorhizobium deserti]|uniref:Uncharacterized protein n=1 Tax=Paramesorhizobium deserti TaxID=1494590 RepID=A0A135HXJ3_9HYPH|nr:hypothetical protein [Paramesorhizobium deserti]KXF77927.1 hypothetical protein ATN84_24740 [Paramesorhizobium deserti]
MANFDIEHVEQQQKVVSSPVSAFLAVFNAAEVYDFYSDLKAKGAKTIDIVSFQGAKFPCTVGIVIGSQGGEMEPFFHSTDGVLQDEQVYFLYGMPEDFLNPTVQPIAELCMSGVFSLSNPFDPKFVIGNKLQVEQSGGGVATGFPVLYGKRCGKLVKICQITFPFRALEASERLNSPLFHRVIDLAALNAMCEIFDCGLRDFHGLPVAMRRAGGDIDSTRYADYSQYRQLMHGHVDAALGHFIDARKDGFRYENVLRIVRALSLCSEIGVLPFAISRWLQILAAHQFTADEQARQFEIEMIRLVSQSPD